MKKLNKKGFTLVELLAVIVILGVILVFAVPNINNLLVVSRKKAANDQALLALKAIDTCSAMNPTGELCDSLGDYYDGDSSNVSITLNDDNTKITKFEVTSSSGYKVSFSDTSGKTTSEIRASISDSSSEDTQWSGTTRTVS